MDIDLATLAPLAARWELRPESATYVGPQEHGFAPFGLAISGHRLRSGRIRATVVFPKQQSVGRVVFGHNAATGAYFSGTHTSRVQAGEGYELKAVRTTYPRELGTTSKFT